MQLLSQAIYAILTADAAITDITGTGNIWHARIPQRTLDGSDAPVEMSVYFYTYSIDPVGASKSGRSEVDHHMVRVVIVGRDDEDMSQVAQYIRYALDRVDPGIYAGIEIDGSEFISAEFDPEGEYELELQIWNMEFKFRVIDRNIRVPGIPIPGNGNQTQVRANVILRAKITLTYEDFATASSTNTIDLFELPARSVVHLVTGQPSEFFDGGTLTDYQIECGIAGELNKYIFLQSVFTGAPQPEAVMTGGSLESMSNTTMLVVTAHAEGGDLDEATQGEIDFWIYYSILN